jgi:hypothetical protein
MVSGDCRAVRARLPELATTPIAAWTDQASAHVSTCQACARALAVERLARGIVVTAARSAEPRPGFSRRVIAAKGDPGGRDAEADLWRPAWVLLPAFGSVAAALLGLFLQSGGAIPAAGAWTGVLGATSVTERLVFEGAAPDADVVLAAVLENGR